LKTNFSIWAVVFMLVCSASLAVAGGKKDDSAQGFNVSGTIAGHSKQYIYFDHFVGGKPERADSALTNKKGKFKMTVADTAANFYRVSLADTNFVILYLAAGDAPVITANAAQLSKGYTCSGSADSELICSFYDGEFGFAARGDSILKQYEAAEAAQDQAGVATSRDASAKLNEDYRKYVLAFIDAHSASPSCLIPLGKLQVTQDFDAFKKVRDGLKAAIPESEYFKQVDQLVTQQEKQAMKDQATAAGGPAQEITMKDTNGVDISLSSLRGKYVLIDFWASWCRPCRAENPNVVRMYNKYKDAGFEVFSVSLDQKRDRWISAIKKDGMTWMHVSDLKGWGNAAAQAYGVSSIPHTLLIDKEGNIIANKLRGQGLEAKLKQIFGF
jgi:peroxiredoxin